MVKNDKIYQGNLFLTAIFKDFYIWLIEISLDFKRLISLKGFMIEFVLMKNKEEKMIKYRKIQKILIY